MQLSSREHEHLRDLSQIRFLVIDEVDRMVQQGSFKELSLILDAVHAANPMDDDDDSDDREEDQIDEDDDLSANRDRLLALPGVPGEAQLEMLTDDIERRVLEQRQRSSGQPPIIKKVDDKELDELIGGEGCQIMDEHDDESLPLPPPVRRQTFVYSATLTLASASLGSRKDMGKRRKKKSSHVDGIDGAIAEILDRAHVKGKTKVVDLSINERSVVNKTNKKERMESKSQFRLPPGLSLRQIKCTRHHKDWHLYAYLLITQQGSSGPCLVFCNSIAGVRRVGKTLETLGMKVRILHAEMQQVRGRCVTHVTNKSEEVQ